MKLFTLTIVLLAVFASVVLADRPSLKKKPVVPVPESAEAEAEDLEKAAPKKPAKFGLKQKPESLEELNEEEVEKESPEKLLLPAINKKPVADDVVAEESSAELLEEVKEKIPPKKPLLGALKPKPLLAELDIQPPENLEQPEKKIELEPPSVISAKPKLPKPALIKA